MKLLKKFQVFILLLTVFPFNLIKYGIVSLVSFLLFKKSSKALADLINKNR